MYKIIIKLYYIINAIQHVDHFCVEVCTTFGCSREKLIVSLCDAKVAVLLFFLHWNNSVILLAPHDCRFFF